MIFGYTCGIGAKYYISHGHRGSMRLQVAGEP